MSSQTQIDIVVYQLEHLKEITEQFQLWVETQQQVIQDQTEQLEQLSKEIQENERKAEELKKDELKTQKKLSPKNERKDKASYIRPDSMFEGVSHIVAQYCGRRKIGYFDRSRIGISKQKKFFWNEEDQEYYTPSSLLAKLTEEVKGKTVHLNCWIADYILVVFADSIQTHLAELDLLHSLKKTSSETTYLSY